MFLGSLKTILFVLWQLSYQCAFLKNLSKLVNFCVAILISRITSLAYYALLFHKMWKRNWNAKKDLFSVWKRYCDWLNTSKVVCEVLSWRFLTGWCSMVRQTSWSWQQVNCNTENNHHYPTWEIADVFKISKSIIENHLYQLAYVNCFDVCVPYKWKNFLDHISTCHSPLKC